MLQHILVGLDGSPLAETILAYVSTLAKSVDADVTLLDVVHLPEDMREGEIIRPCSRISSRRRPRRTITYVVWPSA